MTLHEIPLLLIQMESQQCSEHLFNVRITREQPKWHSNGIWDAKMTLLFFSSIKSSNNVQCTSSKCIYRWVSERVGEWLPRKLLPHSRRIVNFSAVGPFTIRTVSGELGAGLGTIKSLRQLAHYFVFCRKPFNLEPRQRSPCRWEMENCRRGAADLFHLAKKRESVLHARLWVCVYVCAPLSNYFWLFHQWLGITSFGSATPPSASLAFSIFFFLFSSISYFRSTGAGPQRMWCCNWQEKYLYPTAQHWNGNRRQTKQLDFPLRNSPRSTVPLSLFTSLLHARLQGLNCSVHIFTLDVLLCVWCLNEQRTLNSIRRLFSASYFVYVLLLLLLHHFNCFQTQAMEEKIKTKNSAREEREREWFWFSAALSYTENSVVCHTSTRRNRWPVKQIAISKPFHSISSFISQLWQRAATMIKRRKEKEKH